MATSIDEIPSVSIAGLEQAIRAAVRDETPLSLVRLNDGESVFLGYPTYSPAERFHYFLKRWWGLEDISLADYAELKTQVLDASRTADFIGIPDRDHETNIEMKNVFSIIRDNAAFASYSQFTTAMSSITLYKRGFFHALLKELRTVTVISPNANLPGMIERDFDCKVNYVRIIGQHKFFDEGAHFPNEFRATRDAISSMDKGVFLIGAGICGKVYADRVRRMGGIALDCGSILDHWAGKMTRTYHWKLDPALKSA